VVFKPHVDESAIKAHEQWLTSVLTNQPHTNFRFQNQEEGDFLITEKFSSTSPFPEFTFLHRYMMQEFKGYTARIPDILAKSLRVCYVSTLSLSPISCTYFPNSHFSSLNFALLADLEFKNCFS
jgi:hypothetical protein